jgi:hypothetical protein
VIIVAVIALGCLSELSYSQTAQTTLLVQQTPPQGGTVNPGEGVHRLGVNSEVWLTAVAKPGYHFVYWMGDVSNPTTSNTAVYLDSPKIVIAVFERIEYDFVSAVEENSISSAGGGNLFHTAANYSQQSSGGGGGAKRPHKPAGRRPGKPDSEPNEPDFPVPEPVPEPATMALLLLGGLMALRARTGRCGKLKTRQ